MQNKTKTPVQFITIESDYADQRIDNFLITRLKSVPKTHVYRILRKGEIRVNKKRIKPNYRLQSGDLVRIPPLEIEQKEAVPTPHHRLTDLLKNRILYEDKNLLIINKPPGIAVHGGNKVKLGIIEILRTMFPKLPHLELVHRLDLDTSGCLILAKKRSILKELHEMLRQGHNMRKVYWALTQGHWKKNELRVEASLRKNIMQSGERIVRVHEDGKASLTIFKPLETFTDATLVEATLHTGRTHQIRVHAQYRKHPIAGDDKYGDKEFNKKMRDKGLKRLFLHANSIEFTLGSTGQSIRVEAPLDDELKNCLTLLGK